MKKLTVLATALLCCSLAYSQELDVRIIPRVDVNAYVPAATSEDWDVDFGNTSLYTLVEGTFLGNFSYSVANHWLSYSSSGEDISGLYQATLYSDSNNWLDWANLTYTFETERSGSFSLTAGKDVMVIGDYETDAYDWDSHFGMNSMFWNCLPVYQWGGKIGYTSPQESTSVYFQASTSPYGGKMFSEKQHLHLGLIWYGEYGPFRPIWSTNFVQCDEGEYVNIIALGNEFDVGPVVLGVDWVNRARGTENFFGQEFLLKGSVLFNLNDKFEFFAKGGWERFNDETFFDLIDNDYFWGGAGVHWYPLKDSQDLRVHAVVTANNLQKSVSVSLGVLYNFSIIDIFSKQE